MPDWDSPLYSPVIWPGSPCYNPPFRTSGVCNLTKTMDKGLALLKLLPACQEHNPTCPLVQGFLSKKKKKGVWSGGKDSQEAEESCRIHISRLSLESSMCNVQRMALLDELASSSYSGAGRSGKKVRRHSQNCNS